MKLMKIFAENRKAYFNYTILEKFEAGMVLIGTEVKSIKSGRIDLAGSYIVFKDEELFLIGTKIPPYQPKNAPENYNIERPRKLLLNKKEINYLIGKAQERGLVLVPLKVYANNAKIKCEFAVGKGKKKYDKREAIKKRETDREIRSRMSLRG